MLAISSFYHPLQSPKIQEVRQKASQGWRWCVQVLNKHTDLISSGGILVLTTCLLADKLFRIPPFLPRLSLMILNFGGIIWLNVQMRDFIKCSRDFFLALRLHDTGGMVLTAVKVYVRGVDTLLTCGLFAASVVAFIGFPQTTILMYQRMRPFAVSSLVLGVTTEITNYCINASLLKTLNQTSLKIESLMQHFVQQLLFFAKKSKTASQKDSLLAVHIIRQLDTPTLETFQEKMSVQENTEIIRIFYAMKESLENKQAATENNLFLVALGYVCMGICRIFPGSTIEISLRWIMSLLYTDELIKQKFFQSDLAKKLESH